MSLVLDSVTHVTAAARGRAAFCASHGGRYAGYYAAKMGLGAVILNDAGIGREAAGLASLGLLDAVGVPAATVSHRTARIGDGAHGLAHGVVSAVNATAARLGLAPGQSAHDAMQRLDAAELRPAPTPATETESRVLVHKVADIRVHAIDSVALVEADDIGQIVVTGSHGGLLAGRPESAIKRDVFAAVFSDAGFGIDDAGTTRLPALDARGIAAACVSTFSCRIGDGRSVWDDGIVSVINETARGYGATVGQSTRVFVEAMIRAKAGK